MEGEEGSKPLQRDMATTTVKVDGMTCGACTSAVEGGFKGLDGAGAVSVSLVMGRAVVHHDPTKLSAEKVAEIIGDRGFEAEVLSTNIPPSDPVTKYLTGQIEPSGTRPRISTTTVAVEGMTCGACTSSVEAGFKDVPGIKSISVSLLSERAVVKHDAAIISTEQVAEIIEDRGFEARVLDSKRDETASGRAVRNGRSKVVTCSIATTTVAIEGMTCGACTSAVEGAFKDINGLAHFNISLLAERAVVVHNLGKLSAEKIVQLIEDVGFDAKVISTKLEGSQQAESSSSIAFKIYGLPDGAAATALEDVLRQKAGVITVIINLSTSRAAITYNPSLLGLRALVDLIESAGYNALVTDTDDNNAQLESLAKTREIQEWRRAFFISLSFAIPVFCISMMIPMFLPTLDFGAFRLIPGLYLGDVLCMILTVPVQFGIGKRFYISAAKSLKHRSPTMDVLVLLGTSAAFFFSVFAVIIAIGVAPHTKPATVFDTSTMLITFITLGRWLENRAKGQTSKALSRLMSLAPSMATIHNDPIAAEKAAEGLDAPLSPVIEKKDGTRLDEAMKASRQAAGQTVIPTELIEVGDIVILRPGDKVPADGTVTRGESYVDESMVTGEALPIYKTQGNLLMAGTVNGAGRIDFRVTRAGKDTQLSQIVKLVQEAQTSRAPIQRMADLVAGYFVPIILALGFTTFTGWMILSHTLHHPPRVFTEEQSGGKFMVCLKLCISVIVFACPCALGLATPTAVMVGTGVGAENGILVKGGAALETATKITHVVLDKTGTLTLGRMTVAETNMEPTWSSNDWRQRLWWSLVGSAEMSSEHPVGKAILGAAKNHLGLNSADTLDSNLLSFEVTVGRGISATILPPSSVDRTHYEVVVGNANFLESKGIRLRADTVSDARSSNTSGKTGITKIHVAISNQYAGTLSLSDTLKPTAPAAIEALHRMGISTSLVTGDTYSTALSVASLVGISQGAIRASVSPAQKQEIIAELQAQGEIVAMVGDGINDSPALASANIGVSIVSGSDIAVEAADIVLMRGEDLLDIPAAFCLARTIFHRIKLNLLWACVYNLTGLPFAMGVFLPLGFGELKPMWAGLMMAASSVSVVMSSLALKWWKRPKWLKEEALQSEFGNKPLPIRKRSEGVGLVQFIKDTIPVVLGGGKDSGRGAYVPLETVPPPV